MYVTFLRVIEVSKYSKNFPSVAQCYKRNPWDLISLLHVVSLSFGKKFELKNRRK